MYQISLSTFFYCLCLSYNFSQRVFRRRQTDITLTFSNPTYQRSSSEQISLERKIAATSPVTTVKPWRLFKYEKNQVDTFVNVIFN